MQIVKTIQQVRDAVAAAKAQGRSIGFVPTMGALHTGHASLIETAAKKCDFVVVSIFVNPTQFGPSEDFDKYPRDLDADSQLCRSAGADLIFVPEVSEMYPSQNTTWVDVDHLTDHLCGISRPGHFRGVTTVCSKLFNIVTPDFAFFGQKDAQQFIVIKRMVKDLNMSLRIVVCPTIRENDGLAISSRNQYLTPAQRKDAPLLYQALQKCSQLIQDGTRHCPQLIKAAQQVIDQSSDIQIEYLSICSTKTLETLEIITDNALIAVAARLGSTRIIDNLIIDLNKH